MFTVTSHPSSFASSIRNTTHAHASGGSVSDPLRRLQDLVAPNAILNAGGRTDEARCHPGTREEVIGRLECCIDEQAPNMAWLSGPAGAGKTAIFKTIAERCKDRGVQAASFFFFRADSTRNNPRSLVATLLYQIFEFYPPARRAVATVLSEDPLLLDASIQVQFDQLFSSLLHDFPPPLSPSSRRPIVLLIDGLDECDSEHRLSQTQIVQALDRLVTRKDSPFVVLVASRDESQIRMAFAQISSQVHSIFLDNSYSPEQDIRIFVTSEFDRIKRSHPLAHRLMTDWPSTQDVESIVAKSSGQFIFAATIMRYLATSPTNPSISLASVQGIVPIAKYSPLAFLDAIYGYLLSRAENLNAVMDLLSMKLLLASFPSLERVDRFPVILHVMHVYDPRYTSEFLHSCIADLTAIMQVVEEENLLFFHASLPDFLKDQSRAGIFYIDIHACGVKFFPAIWMTAAELSEMTDLGIRTLSVVNTPTPKITEAILTIPPALMHEFTEDIDSLDILLGNIHRLYFSRDIHTYKRIIRKWVSWCVDGLPEMDLSNLESRSLPYVGTYIRMSRIEHWSFKFLKSRFHGKK